MSSIELVIPARHKQLVDGFSVQRLLPYMKKRMIGPFIFLDHMGPADFSKTDDMVVLPHPHIGLATLTWLFQGKILHRDNLGHEQYIEPGEVNWMTSGKGVVHSERSQTPDVLEGVQIWVALPVDKEDMPPSFYHCKAQDLPKESSNGVHTTLIAGTLNDKKSPVPVYSNLFFASIEMKTSSEFQHNLSEHQEAGIYILEGSIDIEGKTYIKHDLIVFKKGHEVHLQSEDQNVRFLFLGGEPFKEKRHIWWNFVSTNKEKIEKAKNAWRNQEFEAVINEYDYIPLPEEK